MQFESFSEFIHMGGHGTFIWSVYLITALVVIGNIWLPLRQKKQFFVDQAALKKREEAAQARTAAHTSEADAPQAAAGE